MLARCTRMSPERYRLLMEQLDALTREVYGCTHDEYQTRFFKLAYDKGLEQGRADERAEANRKKNPKRYAAREDAALRQPGRPALMGPEYLAMLVKAVAVGCRKGETVENTVKKVRKVLREPSIIECPLATLTPKQLKTAYHNTQTRQKHGST
jgi:hypothetical protein